MGICGVKSPTGWPRVNSSKTAIWVKKKWKKNLKSRLTMTHFRKKNVVISIFQMSRFWIYSKIIENMKISRHFSPMLKWTPTRLHFMVDQLSLLDQNCWQCIQEWLATRRHSKFSKIIASFPRCTMVSIHSKKGFQNYTNVSQKPLLNHL